MLSRQKLSNPETHMIKYYRVPGTNQFTLVKNKTALGYKFIYLSSRNSLLKCLCTTSATRPVRHGRKKEVWPTLAQPFKDLTQGI